MPKSINNQGYGPNRDNSPEKPDIAQKTTRGIIWSFVGQLFNKGFTLISLGILARLLTKEDFGLVAAAVIVITFLSVYKDMGLGNALIQYSGGSKKAADTIFTVNMIVGTLLTGIVYLLAPVVALYFENPEITALTRVFGLTFIISAIGGTHVVLLKKELDYRKKVIPEIAGATVKGIFSIGLALSGFGVWSLVFGHLAGLIVSVILVWILKPWRPRLLIDRSVAGRLFRFGGSIMGIDAISAVSENLPFLVIGKICGITLLGVYTLAYRLPEVLIIGNLWVLSGVFFPLFAKLQHQPEKLAEGFKASVRLVSLFATPVSLGLLIIAGPLIGAFYGSDWQEAVPILQVLAVYAWVHSVGYHAGDVFKAIGKPNILLLISAGTVVADLIGLIIGARYGLIGIAWGLLTATIVGNFIVLIISARLINISLHLILLEFKSAFIAGSVFALLALLMQVLTREQNPAIRLIAMSLPASFGYLVVLWIIERDNIIFVADKAGIKLKKKSIQSS